MAPILGRYGPYFLYGFSVALISGVVAALGLTAYLGRRLRLSDWIDGVLIGGVLALVAGRTAFVLLNQEYFGENPVEAWSVWQGGLNYHAALVAGLLGYLLWLRLTQRSTGPYLDLIAPGLAVVVAAGWVACWLEGCAYGQETLPGLLSADLPDDYGVYAVRYRTQSVGFILSLSVAALAAWRAGQTTPGLVFWLALAGISASRAFVAPFRGDAAPLWLGMRLDLLLDLALLVLSLTAAAYLVVRQRALRREPA